MESNRVESHHPDYKDKLEVVWLCPSCHRLLHKGVGENAIIMREQIQIPDVLS